MSTGFAFKQSLHLCSVSNLTIFLVFQLQTFKVGFSGPKPFRGFRETGPRFRSNWNLQVFVFMEGGKPENPEKNPRSKGTTNNKFNPHENGEYWNPIRVTELGVALIHCPTHAPQLINESK